MIEPSSYFLHVPSVISLPTGMPATSSLAESLVGEFNARVKGKQKFCNRPAGAEAVLQVRAVLLSEDGRLERYFAQRPGSPYRRRAA